MRHWVLALAMALAPLSVSAAEPPAGATPETLALAKQLVEVSGAATDIRARMRFMIDPVMRATSGSLPQAQQAQRQALFDTLEQSIEADTPLLLDAATQAYAATYTPDELRGLVAFYQTPIGRALASKQSALAAAMGKSTAAVMPKLLHDMFANLCAKTPCPPDLQKRLDALTGG